MQARERELLETASRAARRRSVGVMSARRRFVQAELGERRHRHDRRHHRALMAVTTFLAVAETALTRMSRSKAQALAEEQRPQGRRRCCGWSHGPSGSSTRSCSCCSSASWSERTLARHPRRRSLRRPRACSSRPFVNVVVIFVVAEAAPKTWAVLHPERAALLRGRRRSSMLARVPAPPGRSREGLIGAGQRRSCRARASSRVRSCPRRSCSPWPTSPSRTT